eukprot:scaffold426_cov319-Pavlova_lutheri.AAC.27
MTMPTIAPVLKPLFAATLAPPAVGRRPSTSVRQQPKNRRDPNASNFARATIPPAFNSGSDVPDVDSQPG